MRIANERRLCQSWLAEDQIQAEIRARVSERVGIEVQVCMLGRVVLLRGISATERQRRRCAEIAMRHPWPRAVINFVTIRAQAPLVDWEIAELIRGGFRTFDESCSHTVAVLVQAGLATLTGVVDQPSDRTALADIARLAPGVARVENLLSCSTVLRRRAADQYRAIRKALNDTHGLAGSFIRLSVGHNVATLSGCVRESWQRDMAAAIVLTHPVSRVVNDLHVEGGVQPDQLPKDWPDDCRRARQPESHDPGRARRHASNDRLKSTADRC